MPERLASGMEEIDEQTQYQYEDINLNVTPKHENRLEQGKNYINLSEG